LATDPCNNTNSCSQTVTVIDTNPPAISLSQSCSPSIIENGQTVTFTGVVGNPGTVGLTNVVVKNLLVNSVVTNLSYLGAGASVPFGGGYTNPDAACLAQTNHLTLLATGTDVCDFSQSPSATNSCTFVVECPKICVTKEIAGFLGT